MAGPIAGRKVRIKYDADGAGAGVAVEIARMKTDSGTLNNEPIDITNKDDAGLRTYLNDVGAKSLDLSGDGIITDEHQTLIGLAANAGEGTALHVFELDVAGVGTFRASFFISSFEVSGAEGSEPATYSISLASSGAITWTAA